MTICEIIYILFHIMSYSSYVTWHNMTQYELGLLMDMSVHVYARRITVYDTIWIGFADGHVCTRLRQVDHGRIPDDGSGIRK
jgi:hypothetical protein